MFWSMNLDLVRVSGELELSGLYRIMFMKYIPVRFDFRDKF